MAEMTEAELLDYFNEHVYYEMLMLRFSSQRLEIKFDQLEWNVMFAAFNVSARNLSWFLTNGDKGTNVKTLDYNAYRTADFTALNEDVKGTLQKMNAQCFHLGRKRKREAGEKIGLERTRAVTAWVISNMDKFIQSLKEEIREKLRPEWNEILLPGLVISIPGQRLPAASSLSWLAEADHTSSPTMMSYKAGGTP